jgi:hypothetical protein
LTLNDEMDTLTLVRHTPVSNIVEPKAFLAVEKLVQRVFTDRVLSDFVFSPDVEEDVCSGHRADTPKAWLAGYFFEDESVDVAALTNVNLLRYINPLDEKWVQNVNFVYDSLRFEEWCPGFDSSMQQTTSSKRDGE